MHHNINADLLQKIFGFRLQHCKFLLLILRGLCTCETICLSRLSLFLGYQHQKSAYQRIRRFLSKIVFCQETLAKAFVAFSGIEAQPKWIVILDRTYWMFGKTHLSFLYMSVCAGPVCIPLFFILLGPNKKGNSGFEDRKYLLDLFIKCFGADRILYLLGDREFIGEQWLTYLITLHIPLAQRLKEKGQMVANTQGAMVKAHLLFQDLCPNEERYLGWRKIGRSGEVVLQIYGIKTNKGDLVIVASQNVMDPLEVYKNRWAIEICFRSLKSNGFHIEDSHVTLPNRIVCLLNIASLAYALTINIANLLVSKKPRKVKKHGYPEKGLIRYALDLIKPILLRIFRYQPAKLKAFIPSYYLKLVG
jgi:hypothetical protein